QKRGDVISTCCYKRRYSKSGPNPGDGQGGVKSPKLLVSTAQTVTVTEADVERNPNILRRRLTRRDRENV
ncbi:12040_t:CDS:2, partial [Acaulospora colombiana]